MEESSLLTLGAGAIGAIVMFSLTQWLTRSFEHSDFLRIKLEELAVSVSSLLQVPQARPWKQHDNIEVASFVQEIASHNAIGKRCQLLQRMYFQPAEDHMSNVLAALNAYNEDLKSHFSAGETVHVSAEHVHTKKMVKSFRALEIAVSELIRYLIDDSALLSKRTFHVVRSWF